MITVIPMAGFCNYLRVVFSFYEYAKSIDEKLTVIWLISTQCNGYLLDYFEPIPNIVFLLEPPENIVIEDIKLNVYEEKPNLIYKGWDPHPLFSPYEYSSLHNGIYIFKYLKLLPYMNDKIIEKQHIIGNNYISVHIRRTDHIELAKEWSGFTTDNDFIQFIDKFENTPIYIATDNKETYNLFKQKYNNRIPFEYHKELSGWKESETWEGARHTTLEDAILDIYLCVYSTHFMGSGISSFSHTINSLRIIHNSST